MINKRIVITLVCVLGSLCGIYAQDYKADFKKVQQQFQERLKTTPASLKEYVQTYPYTPYIDEIHLMEGVLLVEKKKYKQAIKEFESAEGEIEIPQKEENK